MSPPFLETLEEYRQLVDTVDTFLLDCDGVIYHGPVVVEGVKEVLKMFRAAGKPETTCDFVCGSYLMGTGKKVIFVTNNASKSRRMYKTTFDKLGIEVKEVRLSSLVTRNTMSQIGTDMGTGGDFWFGLRFGSVYLEGA